MTDEELKQVQTDILEKDIPYIDLNSSELTPYAFFNLVPVDHQMAGIDWNGITIVSNPCQKRQLNYWMTFVSRDADGLGVLQNFWDNVKWTVDWGHHPEVVDIYRGNQLIGKVIRVRPSYVQNLRKQ